MGLGEVGALGPREEDSARGWTAELFTWGCGASVQANAEAGGTSKTEAALRGGCADIAEDLWPSPLALWPQVSRTLVPGAPVYTEGISRGGLAPARRAHGPRPARLPRNGPNCCLSPGGLSRRRGREAAVEGRTQVLGSSRRPPVSEVPKLQACAVPWGAVGG